MTRALSRRPRRLRTLPRSPGSTWTVRDALVHASARIAARDAALLLGAVTGLSRPDLYLHPERLLSAVQRQRFVRAVAARRRGMPVAYLTGSVTFHEVALDVRPGVLIPRPETETLVEAVLTCLDTWEGGSPPQVLADVGTGSGAIAVAVAAARPAIQVLATDRSERALALARANAVAAGVGERVRVLAAGDLLAPLRRVGAQVELIVMNPPYVARRDLARLAREVRHEPRLALDGGADGLSVVRRLLSDVARGDVLRPGGWLWLEVGRDQAARTRQELIRAGFTHPVVDRDLAGVERVVGARWPLSR